MKFLIPQFLWALTALSIPLIIHLFNFRRYKTVFFSNTNFLRKVEKNARAVNRLRNFIILLLRMLALAMLIILFAQPYIPSEKDIDSGSHVAIYLDNSPSLSVKGKSGNLSDMGRQAAADLIRSMPDNYRFQIVTNSFEGREQRFYSREDALNRVDEIDNSPAFRKFDEVFTRIKSNWENANQEGENLDVFVISDFQKSQFEEFEVDVDDRENFSFNFIYLEGTEDLHNIAIDSLWFEQPILQPGFGHKLHLQLSNDHDEPVENLSVKVEVNEELLGVRQVDIGAASTEEFEFDLLPGQRGGYRGIVKIDAGEPHFDNEFYFSFTVADPLKVFMTGSESANKRIEKLYGDSIFELNYADPKRIDFGSLANYDLIIISSGKAPLNGFEQALRNHLEQGRNILLLPDNEGNESSSNLIRQLGLGSCEALVEREQKAARVNWDDPLFENTFREKPEKPELPEIKKYYPLRSGRSYPIVELENGEAIISRIPMLNGQVLYFGVGLEDEFGSLSRHTIIVPTMLNAALKGKAGLKIYNVAGSRTGQSFDFDGQSEDVLEIVGEDGLHIIPRQRNNGNTTEIFDLPAGIQPGNYEIMGKGKSVGPLAVNVAREESQWSFLTIEDLENLNTFGESTIYRADNETFSAAIGNANKGTPLWKWFLLAAAIFLLIEMLLLKIWK